MFPHLVTREELQADKDHPLRVRAKTINFGILYGMGPAKLMDTILSDGDLRDTIVEGQLAAVDRLRSKDFAGTLLTFILQILACPRAAAPHVMFDFWHQFDAAEELEELRMTRPSIYRALPEHP